MDTGLSIEQDRRASRTLVDEGTRVLEAIKVGNVSVPQLKAATGIEYARLHTVLYYLEFEERKIKATETSGGFARYEIAKVEKLPPGSFAPVTPQAFKVTPMSLQATQFAIDQRDAPHCVKCHAMMFLYGLAKRKHQDWKCPKCKEIYQGSRVTKEKAVAHINPEEVVNPVARERVSLGKAEEAALERMRGKEVTCDCGRPTGHRGRCALPPITEEASAELRANPDVLVQEEGDFKKYAEMEEDEMPRPPMITQKMVDDYKAQYPEATAPEVTPQFGSADVGEKMVDLSGAESDIVSQSFTEPTVVEMSPMGDKVEPASLDERLEQNQADTKEWAEGRDFKVDPSCEPDMIYKMDKLPLVADKARRAIRMSEIPQAGPVVIDGQLRMNITLNIDAAEMAKWSSTRISRFWGGLAQVIEEANKK